MSFRGKCYRGKNLGENVTKGKTLQGKMLQGKMFQGKTAFPRQGDMVTRGHGDKGTRRKVDMVTRGKGEKGTW